jgi:hypothetical protein
MIECIKNFYIVTSLLIFALVGEMVYFSSSRSMTSEELQIKKDFAHIVKLPDLSIATEAHFIRFRSLTDVCSSFNESPEILDYFPTSFTYYPALKDKNQMPSKVIIK